MKIRIGFVSNSSSSSFVILKKGLNDEQKNAIVNHITIAETIAIEKGIKKDRYGYELYGLFDVNDRWNIHELDMLYFANNSMDNFELGSFLVNEFNIPKDNFCMRDDGWFMDNEIPTEIKEYDFKLLEEDRKNKLNRII